MTETSTAAEQAASTPRKTSGALGGKVLAELQEIAADLGITDIAGLRKGALIDAIKAARGDAPKAEKAAKAPKAETAEPSASADQVAQDGSGESAPAAGGRRRRRATGGGGPVETPAATTDAPVKNGGAKNEGAKNDGAKNDGAKNDGAKNDGAKNEGGKNEGAKNEGAKNEGGKPQQNQGQNQGQGKGDGGNATNNRHARNQQGNNQGNQNTQGGRDAGRDAARDADGDDDGTGRRRNRRGRNRGGRGLDGEILVADDDVLVPAAGIVDILDNYAFVRTTGYLPSDNDVYVSLSMARAWGLRRGDAVVGQVRQPREGERKEKFNPMVRVDSVNGMSVEEARQRVEFARLTPVLPVERLRLAADNGEADPTGRLIDLVAPLGKGQRGMIIAPPSSGKTAVLQQIAQGITAHNSDSHLMVVLVDERPEEVTEFQRSIRGEVIASTFDRPAVDHTTVAELAIERAKRLVELGHDVVVLLDGLTRLGRAYNVAAPASGRVLDGGVDAAAVFASKRFLGAARNIENGGSLTIVATASAETGSRTDEVLLEEFVGAVNWDLRMRRGVMGVDAHPAVDVTASGTVRSDLLLAPEEVAAAGAVRAAVADLEPKAADLLLGEALRASSSASDLQRRVSRS